MSTLSDEDRNRIAENRRKALAIQEVKRIVCSESARQLVVEDDSTKCSQIWDGEICAADGIDEEFMKAFGEKACRRCRVSLPELGMMSKRLAKEEFLLPDDTFLFLPSLEKSNPHHESWTTMKLYLRKNLISKAIKRFGSLEALVEEKEKRRRAKFVRELNRVEEQTRPAPLSQGPVRQEATHACIPSLKKPRTGSRMRKNISGLIASIRGPDDE